MKNIPEITNSADLRTGIPGLPFIFHSDHLEQTIVPVVTIGKINDDVSMFAEYEGSVSIEVIEK